MKNLREVTWIRTLVKPYKDFKRKVSHEYYLRTPDSWYLKTLKNIHLGKRCIIVGNGPSLLAEDLDKLKGEYTFAANRIFNIFTLTDWRPSYYLAVDDKVIKEVENQLKKYDLGHIFLQYDECSLKTVTNKLTKIYTRSLLFEVDYLKWKYDRKTTYISKDISNHFCDGGTVTFTAIQLAIYMGFKEIYLLGVDHHYSTYRDATGKLYADPSVQDYFDHKRYSTRYDMPYNTVQYAYEIAREYCDRHDIGIYNATRGGKLEVFKRVDFDELMRK